jgi:hypothetical protein
MELAEWGFLSAIAFVWSSGFCGREGRVNAAVWGISVMPETARRLHALELR